MRRLFYGSALRRSACRAYKPDARLQKKGRTEKISRNIPGVAMRRCSYVLICVLAGVALAGCPKNNGHADYKAGDRAFDLKDYEVVTPFVMLSEQADAQRQQMALQENIQREMSTATGQGKDFDLEELNKIGKKPPAQTEFNLKRQPPASAEPGGMLATQ